jgi:O-antigen/teichoic acid export membrane protein
MIRLKEKIKSWMGPLWWYAAILFVGQRFGDVINVFVGLWLVPKYVPQSELGAVLPLAQVGSVLGLPLTILMIPFTKFLNTYATRGEFGKVKRLLRDVFVLAAVLFVGTLVYARFFMPLVFTRMRVTEGSLGLLIVASGVINSVSSVFSTALLALKRFRLIGIMSLLGAPIRLIAMLVFMPFRALSGYFVGQSAPSIFAIIASFFGLRQMLGRQVKSESYWAKDWGPIIRYTVPVAVFVMTGAIQVMVETFVIRHRLPDMDSAGYYVISRFAEIGAYTGMTLIVVLFTLASEKHEQGERSHRLLWQSMGGTLGSGLFLAAVFYFSGRWLLGLSPAWADYVAYAPQLAVLTVIIVIRVACACFVNFEMACGRFKFVSYFIVISGIESVLLYGLTGYGFFEGLLPSSWIDWMVSMQAARLDFLLQVMLWFSMVTFSCVVLHLWLRSRLLKRK